MNRFLRPYNLTIALLCLYAILVLYTVISGFIGAPYQPFFTPLLTFLAFSFALVHGSQHMGWKLTLLLLALTFTVSLFFESLGVATGLVYGPYHYTDKLGAKFLGLVPYLIPVAWFMMTYPSFIIAGRVIPSRMGIWSWRFLLAAIGAVIMTAWDLAMDPMMVAGGHWVWEVDDAYFGVPLQNYWGWWLTVFVTYLLFLGLGKITPTLGQASSPSFERLAVILYAIAGLSTVIIDLQAGLGGPALAGFFAMLPWVVVGWWKYLPQ